MLHKHIRDIEIEFYKKFEGRDGALRHQIVNLKSFLKSSQISLLKKLINELETNPNEDGSISPNIQHWIKAKQRQLLKQIKALKDK